MTFFPYSIMPRWLNILGIFIGTDKFSCFPVVQYLPLFLTGLYIRKANPGRLVIATLFIPSAALSIQTIAVGLWQPVRFPPNAVWILSTIWPVLLVYGITKAAVPLINRPILRQAIIYIGKYTLGILVISNIVLFAISWRLNGAFGNHNISVATAATILLTGIYISLNEFYKSMRSRQRRQTIKHI